MIMMTPAEFEDQMREAVAKKDSSLIIDLMCRALIDNGYESGIRLLNRDDSRKKQPI